MSEIAVRPRRVVERAREVLADRGRALFAARVLVDGVAYKPDVADLRESPALEILERLHTAGAIVAYRDPYFAHIALRDGTVLEDTVDPVAFAADLVLLHTSHTSVDRSWLVDATTVLDTTYRGTDVPQRILL